MTTSLASLRLSGEMFKTDPYPIYARLRAEAPAFSRTSRDGNARMWWLTRHADVAAALRQPDLFVKDVHSTLNETEHTAPAPPLYRLLTHHMLNADGARHARLRTLVSKAFSARQIEGLEPQLRATAHRLLDRVSARGQMDYIQEFALPFSIAVIGDLLGIPSRDHHRFRAWSHILVAPSSDSARNLRKTARLQQVMNDFVFYLEKLCTERRRSPQPDLISFLLAAEEQGDSLNTEELFSMVLLLTVVGHETSVFLLADQLLILLSRPLLWAALRADRTLLAPAIEEAIRFDGPVERATVRFAAADIDLHGQTLRRGDAVSLVLASAHRDETVYPCPTHYDLDRPALRHLGFGQGIHYCLGAPLARLEARIALETLLDRLPTLQQVEAPAALRWQTNPILRGPRQLLLYWKT